MNIIKNGEIYAVMSQLSSNVIFLTLAEYENLSDDEKYSGIVYAILDDVGSEVLPDVVHGYRTTQKFSAETVSVELVNYDPVKMTQSGTVSATDIGDYYVNVTPKTGYVWPDGTNATKQITWEIVGPKKPGYIYLSQVWEPIYNATQTLTQTYEASGTVTATSSDSSVCSVSVTDSTIVLSFLSTGNCTININVESSTNYTATSKSVSFEVYPAPVVVGVQLNLNDSDPSTWATYTDSASGSTDWDTYFGHYPVLWDKTNKVELGRLNTHDFSKYTNGSSAPVTTANNYSMVAFPRHGVQIQKSGSVISIRLTTAWNDPDYTYYAHTWLGKPCDKFYLGMYPGCDTYLRSYVSNNSAPYTSSASNLINYAHNNGDNYEVMSFYQYTYLQCMYLLKYKGTISRTTIGYGRTYTTYTIDASSYYTAGMDHGTVNDNTKPIRLFGLLDLWGNGFQLVGGISRYYQQNSSYLYWATNQNAEYQNNGQLLGYKFTGQYVFSRYGYLRYPYGSNDLGFLPDQNTSYGSATTYFGSGVSFNSDTVDPNYACSYFNYVSCEMWVGGEGSYSTSTSKYDYSGLFSMYETGNPTSASTGFGRIMYMKFADV